ncbi:hypothetical protein BH10PAT1_BH10PAT1_5840 [soil metagenome]
MHAFLIIGDSKDYINKFPGKKIEFPFAKIADNKELNNFTKYKLNEKTVIVLKDFDKANTETQNSFLKSLEEPQENLSFILTATNIEKILPTIVSRSEVIEINSKSDISDEDINKTKEFVTKNIGEKLVVTSKINKREDAIEFTNKLILGSHNLFLENPELVIFLDEANKLKRNLEANGNVQLHLTNFVINLSSL